MKNRIQKHLNNPVTIFLTNGIKLCGTITDLDDNALTLTRDDASQSERLGLLHPNGRGVCALPSLDWRPER